MPKPVRNEVKCVMVIEFFNNKAELFRVVELPMIEFEIKKNSHEWDNIDDKSKTFKKPRLSYFR